MCMIEARGCNDDNQLSVPEELPEFLRAEHSQLSTVRAQSLTAHLFGDMRSDVLFFSLLQLSFAFGESSA